MVKTIKPKLNRLLAKLNEGKQVTIVTLGDSNTELTFHTMGQLNFVGLLDIALFHKYGGNKVIMINSGCCGEAPADGLKRLQRDVLRFLPDLVIICYRKGDISHLKKIVETIQSESHETEILLRTPNPAIATNPSNIPGVEPGKEIPNQSLGEYAKQIVSLGRDKNYPVVDHYNLWLESDIPYSGPPTANPNKLWLRMSDSIHPGSLGHLAFFREMAPFFELPKELPWE